MLISEKLWRRKFGADPAIEGKRIVFSSVGFTVIGVISDRQAFPAWADAWIPLSLLEPELKNRRKSHPLEVVARLKPGVNLEQAEAEIQSISQRLARSYPDTNGTVGARLVPLERQITGDVRPSLLLVWAAVGLVLLIACANVAHLLLARIEEQRDEMAIRFALGAGAGHLIRHVLTESLMLSAVGGAAGTGLALWMNGILRNMAQGQIPRLEGNGIGVPVWIFAITATIFSGLLFGLPACWEVLRRRRRIENGRTVTRARSRTGSIMIAAEVTLAFVVLAGAALLLRSFAVLLSEDPGFRATGVIAVDVPAFRSWEDSWRFFDTRVLPAIRSLPGVRDAAVVNCAPLSLGPTEQSRYSTRFGIQGRDFPPGQYPVAQVRWVTPDYFRVLGIPLKHGRLLTNADESKAIYVINDTFAQRFFPGQDPLAHRIITGVMDGQALPVEIAGVVGDVRDLGLDREAEPTLYLIQASPVMTLLVKTSGDLAQSMSTIRETLHRIDPELPVTNLQPLDQYVRDSIARRRFALLMFGAFGGLAALLTAIGIYGLLASSVNARTREFGVRAAVGATPATLIRMVMGEIATVVVPGLAAGAALAFGLAGLMQSLVYRLSPTDPWSIASAGLFLALLAALSAWLPAWRAARVNISAALRSE